MNTFALTPKKDKMTFDREVERVLTQMSTMSVDSEEYRDAVSNLKVLCDARGQKTNRTVSADIIVSAATNLLGIILILQHERMNVVTSKAISFIFKGRV